MSLLNKLQIKVTLQFLCFPSVFISLYKLLKYTIIINNIFDVITLQKIRRTFSSEITSRLHPGFWWWVLKQSRSFTKAATTIHLPRSHASTDSKVNCIQNGIHHKIDVPHYTPSPKILERTWQKIDYRLHSQFPLRASKGTRVNLLYFFQ